MDAVNLLDTLKAGSKSSINLLEWKENCYNAMNDDFNTPILIANLFEAVKYINLISIGKESLIAEELNEFKILIRAFVYDVLGLESESEKTSGSEKLSGVVALLIDLRNEARENKNWALSDQIRDELMLLGIQLKDGKEGTTFSIN
jgi:cysteinyl-tRNA synthetase